MPSGFPPTGERGKPATEEAGSCWDLLAAGNHAQRGGLLGPTHRDAGARETEGGVLLLFWLLEHAHADRGR